MQLESLMKLMFPDNIEDKISEQAYFPFFSSKRQELFFDTVSKGPHA